MEAQLGQDAVAGVDAVEGNSAVACMSAVAGVVVRWLGNTEQWHGGVVTALSSKDLAAAA